MTCGSHCGTQEEMRVCWTHKDLVADLAAHLRLHVNPRVVITEAPIGPAGSPCPDVYSVRKSFVRPEPTIYEVKVSVGDFRSDVTSSKWLSYLPLAQAVYFACPAGLVAVRDLPNGAGLIVRHEGGWRVRRAATRHPSVIPEGAWIRMLLRLSEQAEHTDHARWIERSDLRRRLAADVADYVRDKESALLGLENLRSTEREIKEKLHSEITRIREDALRDLAEARRELCGLLGVEETAERWELRQALDEAKSRVSADAEVQRLRKALREIKGAVVRFSSDVADDAMAEEECDGAT